VIRNPVRRLHNVFGLVFGTLLLFWTVSGLFFTLFPIEKIRGATLRAEIDHGELVLAQVTISAVEAANMLSGEPSVKTAELGMFMGEPVWKLAAQDGTRMVSARTGEVRSPISTETAMGIAREGIVSEVGAPGVPHLMTEDPPREYAGPLPAYVIDYDPGSVRIYVDANTGKLVTVRSNLWRAFDVMWRFHILDITGSDRFDSWWLKLASFFGLAIVMTGGVLAVQRVCGGTIFK